MKSYMVKLPHGYRVDACNLPADFDAQIGAIFAAYTEGTNPDYCYQDKLLFIDQCCRTAHRYDGDPFEAVDDLIKERFAYDLDEYGEICDKDDFYTKEFMVDCFNKGLEMKLYAHYTDDRHIDDAIMKMLERIIRVVISWEEK